jgi:CHAT domain-containing protein
LRGPDGQPILQSKDVRLVLTGRDLLRPPLDRPASGLVALGDIAFNLTPTQQAASERRGVLLSRSSGSQVGRTAASRPVASRQASTAAAPQLQPAEVATALESSSELDQLRERAEGTLRGGGFGPLPATKEEVEAIADAYHGARRDEPMPVVLEGADASKMRLLAQAPARVLHLATHGFYWGKERPTDRPMLLAGIALAGANEALHGGAQNGILYAIEAQDLNLEGTELVVLSACNTAQGQIDYGEGVSGLVRALRTAGARNVLVSLRPVEDAGTAAFMQRFYFHWLAQGRASDPAAALRATQQEYLDPNFGQTSDQIWTSFILIGG